MNKTLVALTIAASTLLYSGCSRDYKKYTIDGNKVLYSTENSSRFHPWDIIETKKDSSKIFYNFITEGYTMSPFFNVDGHGYSSENNDTVSVTLNNRLHYLLHKIDSIDKAEERKLIKKINE